MEKIFDLKINPRPGHSTIKSKSTDTSKLTIYPYPDTPSTTIKTPFLLSTSQIESSPNTRSRSYKRKSISNLDLVNNISDLNDKFQIQQAINSAETLRNRVQIVDMLLKKRNEKFESENQAKLTRAAPLLQSVSLNFRNRIKKMKERQGKCNFLKTLLSDNSMDVPPQFIQETSTEKQSLKINLDIPEESPRKKKSGLHLYLEPDYVIDNLNSPTSKSPRSTPRNDTSNLSQTQPKLSIKSGNISVPSSPTSARTDSSFPVSRKERTKLNLSLGKKASAKNSQDSMMSNSDRGKSYDPMEKFRGTFTPKYRKEKEIKEAHKTAKGEIEKDLYKYLLKHKKEKEYQDLVLQISDTRRKKIKNIEEKVKEKFEGFLESQKHSQDLIEEKTEINDFTSKIKRPKVILLLF